MRGGAVTREGQDGREGPSDLWRQLLQLVEQQSTDVIPHFISQRAPRRGMDVQQLPQGVVEGVQPPIMLNRRRNVNLHSCSITSDHPNLVTS